MSDYTPTTEEVRAEVLTDFPSSLRPAEFDRWLAEVKAKVWQEGYDAKWHETYFENNPYRQGEEK